MDRILVGFWRMGKPWDSSGMKQELKNVGWWEILIPHFTEGLLINMIPDPNINEDDSDKEGFYIVMAIIGIILILHLRF